MSLLSPVFSYSEDLKEGKRLMENMEVWCGGKGREGKGDVRVRRRKEERAWIEGRE